MHGLLLIAQAVAAVTPVMPSTEAVFDDPVIRQEIAAHCAKTATTETCVLATSSSVSRLRYAYASSATTADQRMKMLSLIDADRARGAVDWAGIGAGYFSWRGNVTGDTQRHIAKLRQQQPAPATSTVETRCWSGYYSSRCVTTAR